MPSQQDLIDRFSFDALAGGNDRLWQQARHWARSNATIRATIADVRRGYRSIKSGPVDGADTTTDTSTTTHASTSRAAGRLSARRAQIAAQRDRHGWTDDDGPAAA